MFKKLVANLPFNPSLITQVGFYADRLKKEKSIRRLSFVFISLAMFIQMFAVIAPPERSLAASSNHIQNGIRTRQDILNGWDFYGSDLAAIYEQFGITRADIAALPLHPNETIRSTDKDYWSIGRNSLTGYSNVHPLYKISQVKIQHLGKNTASTADDRYIYQRALRAWDIKNPSNTYRAFRGTISATGQPFWILVDCGNLTTIGSYTPPPPPPTPEKPTPPPPPTPEPPKPKIEIKKTIVDNPSKLNPGDSLTYRIEYRNSAVNSLAKDVVIEDQLDTKNYDIISPKNLSINNGFLKHDVGSLSYSTSYNVLSITVKLKDQVPSGTKVCNKARITSKNATAANSNEVCVGVIVECPYDSRIPDVNNPNCVEPKIVCSVVDAAINRTTREVTYKTIVTSSNPENTDVISYNYDFGDGANQEFKYKELEHQTKHSFGAGDYTTTVTITYRTTGQEETGDKTIDCSVPISFEEDQPLGQSKSVSNITQDKTGEIAESSLVNGGDVLEYTLLTTNSQNYDREGLTVDDYIGDLLDYSTLDMEFLKEQGGAFDEESNKIIWNDVSILGASSAEHKFRVTIKDPIPSTNAPSTVSTSYDCKISNEYGTEITMDINCPLVKNLETLPNTGPGAGLTMTVGATTVIGYFFARTRLLAKEIGIIRKDYVTSGGV